MAPPFPRPHVTNASFISLELLYATIIITICILIYYRTREFYSLSKHEGIRHFREAFLFFALAYFFRLIPTLFRMADLHLPGYRIGFTAGFFLFSYASAMATMSIARSVTWKRLKKGLLSEDLTYHLLALLLAMAVFITWNIMVFFFTQALLIVAAFVLTNVSHRQQKKKSKMYYTYLLLLLFWMMNIAIISTPLAMAGLREALYLLSLALFIIILYKVIGRTRG